MLPISGMRLGKKMMKVLVLWFAFKKQSVPPLIQLTLETLPHVDLINLKSFHQGINWGGLLVLWNSSIFSGQIVEARQYGLTIDFTASHDQKK